MYGKLKEFLTNELEGSYFIRNTYYWITNNNIKVEI